MTTIINGSSPSITFSDSTTQASAGLTAASPTIASGVLTFPNGATNGGYINGGTAVASTSGTSIDFTGIPSWVKRITVMFSGVSTNGTSNPLIQVGSGSVSTTGYTSSNVLPNSGGTTGGGTNTTGFGLGYSSASNIYYGTCVITLFNSNTYIASYNIVTSTTGASVVGGGVSPVLSGALDRVRITTVNGTDTFDAGSINILYE